MATGESNNTRAGGIKACSTADHCYHSCRAFIPRACGGNGVPTVGCCTIADRRRQPGQRPGLGEVPSALRAGGLEPPVVLPGGAAPLLYIMWLWDRREEVRSEPITTRYVKAGQVHL